MNPNTGNPFADMMIDAMWHACVSQCPNPLFSDPVKTCERFFISREQFDKHIAPELRELERLRSVGTAKYAAFLEVARTYRALWLIVHESSPHAPKGNETMKLGHLRGQLFAAIDQFPEAKTAAQDQSSGESKLSGAVTQNLTKPSEPA